MPAQRFAPAVERTAYLLVVDMADRGPVEVSGSVAGGALRMQVTGEPMSPTSVVPERVAALGGTLLVDERPDGRGAAVRVAVLEDQVLTRAGIVATLQEAGIDVVAAVGAADDLHRVVALEQVDVALLDVRLPPTYSTEGLDAAARIRREQPAHRGARAVAAPRGRVRRVACWRTAGGGCGYLLKDRVLEPATLVDALRRVMAGECVLDPAIVAELVR